MIWLYRRPFRLRDKVRKRGMLLWDNQLSLRRMRRSRSCNLWKPETLCYSVKLILCDFGKRLNDCGRWTEEVADRNEHHDYIHSRRPHFLVDKYRKNNCISEHSESDDRSEYIAMNWSVSPGEEDHWVQSWVHNSRHYTGDDPWNCTIASFISAGRWERNSELGTIQFLHHRKRWPFDLLDLHWFGYFKFSNKDYFNSVKLLNWVLKKVYSATKSSFFEKAPEKGWVLRNWEAYFSTQLLIEVRRKMQMFWKKSESGSVGKEMYREIVWANN